MASTYSDLKIELIGTGEQTGTWGNTTNNNFSVAVGEAITGSADVAFSSADVTITLTNTNASQAARNLRLNLTGTSGGARNLILGSGCQIEKLYLINNGLADVVTVKNTSGTGIVVPAGKSMFVFNNGTNVVDAITSLSAIGTGVFDAGTVSAPSITTTGDTNTGIFFPAADTIAFTEGGVESMRIDSSGNVGINVTSPSQRLELAGVLRVKNGNADTNGLNFSSDVDGVSTINSGFAGAGVIRFLTSDNEKMRITNAGNVGIGTSSPACRLDLNRGSAGLLANFTDGVNTNFQIETASLLATIGPSAGSTGMAFKTANTERMRIDSVGNVGIGTSSPATFNSKLCVVGGDIVNINDSASWLVRKARSDNSNSMGIFDPSGFGAMALYTAAAERMRIDSAGNVGIGTSSPASKLTVIGEIVTTQSLTIGTGGVYQAGSIYSDSNFGMLFRAKQASPAIADFRWANSADTERMRIDSGGNLLIGTTTNSGNARIAVSGAGTGGAYLMRLGSSATGAADADGLQFIFGDGVEKGSIRWNSSNTAYNTSSDYRLKENIAPMTGALDLVQQLKPVTYNWKIDGSNGQGFIAHELQEVVPDCVTGEKDAVDAEGKPKYQGIDTSFLVATLTAALQEQQALIQNLTTRLNALEGK